MVEAIWAVRLPGAVPCPDSIDRDQLDSLLTEYRFDGAGLAWLAALRPATAVPPDRMARLRAALTRSGGGRDPGARSNGEWASCG